MGAPSHSSESSAGPVATGTGKPEVTDTQSAPKAGVTLPTQRDTGAPETDQDKANPTTQRPPADTTTRSADPGEMYQDTEKLAQLASQGDDLLVLEEAVDDGSVVKTAGTLFLTSLEAFDLPETESHGGLLGYDRQDLYLSMGLQTEHGCEQQSATSVKAGRDGAVVWGDETISITYSNAGDTVTAEIWNENPGSDVMIGKATITRRHMRALAARQDNCARIRLPLTRQRTGGRTETRGILVGRVRLVRDENNTRSTGPENLGVSVSPSHVKEAKSEEAGTVRGETAGFLVCSGLTAYDLPSTEGLMYGGSQDPYVKVILGPNVKCSRSVAGRGKMCAWASQTLRFRVDPSREEHHIWGRGLVVEVWNDNQSRTDALMGKGFVRPEALTQLERHPGNRGLPYRVKLSRQGKGPKGTVSMVIRFEPDQPGAVPAQVEQDPSREMNSRYQPEETSMVLITQLVAKDLGETMAFGFGELDKVELYVVARSGIAERATPAAAVVSGKSAWTDACLALPLTRMAPDSSSLLRLELWTLNPIQDDHVGYVEVDLASLLFGHHEANSGNRKLDSSAPRVSLEHRLHRIAFAGASYEDVRPGVLSCTFEVGRNLQGAEEGKGVVEVLQHVSGDNTPRGGAITLPVIGPTEGPGVLKVVVVDTTLHEEVEAPEVRLTLIPGKRFATTRPLLDVGGDASEQGELQATAVWNEELEIPCYGMDFAALGDTVALQVELIVAGVLAGQRVFGQGQMDVSEAIRSRKQRDVSLDVTSQDRGSAPFLVGKVSLSILFVDAWETLKLNGGSPSYSESSSVPQPLLDCLHCPGILRVFVVDARELSGLKPQQDPYVVVERMAADPTIACQSKPFISAVATVVGGREARWLESCDLRIGQAEADFLRGQPGGGSVGFTVTLTDKDVRGGDECISSLEVVVTPGSLAERESSVLWHRLFSQGRDRGFLRLGCCWIPADLEPLNVCGLRPEERVEAGTLYLWLKEGRDLVNPTPAAQRVRGLPPTCEVELRPYAKVGRKKARDVLGCARLPEPHNPDLDSGIFHKFVKMDFAEVAPRDDEDLAETSPSFLVSVYTRLGEKKIVSGRAEIVLASLCGYKHRNGEAVLRFSHPDPNTTGGRTRPAALGGANKGFDGVEGFSCPVAAVDKVIPLLEDEYTNAGGWRLGSRGRGGELRLRALYVPDRFADALGVRSAVKALSRAAEISMQAFTEKPPVALPRDMEDQDWVGEGSDSQVLDVDATALPGVLEVHLNRATHLEQMAVVEPVVLLRLVCSAGGEMRTSDMGRCSETGVEWNHQFSLLVDDANMETLEILVLDGNGCQKPVARCKIPLRRYAQSFHASKSVDIGQVTPERFKLTDHRGRGYRGHIILSLNFLPEVVGQTHILQEAFAPTTNFLPTLPKTTSRKPSTGTTDVAKKADSKICVMIVCMDGGDISRDDRVRVRVSLAADSDDWEASTQFSGAASAAAISGVGVVDEEAAMCRWDSRGGAMRELGGETNSPFKASGELLTLPWDPQLPVSAWGRGRASVLKFEISRGPGRPAEWMGFVPTSGLVHSPRSVFERAIPLMGRVGAEPPTSARTVASNDRHGVSLEIALVFHPALSSTPGASGNIGTGTGEGKPAVAGTRQPTPKPAKSASVDVTRSPFHPDLRRIPSEAGELVVHCLRARNLRLPKPGLGSLDAKDVHPEVFLTAVPDGGEAATSTPSVEPGGRHPVWAQTLTLSIADAITARVIVRVRNINQNLGDNVMGEIELSMAGIIAAEHGMAAAATLQQQASCPPRAPASGESSGRGPSVDQKSKAVVARRESKNNNNSHNATRRKDNEQLARKDPSGGNRREPVIHPRGVEAWFPIFVCARQGGSRERELVGEVRLGCRFLSADFMLQRELTAGADEGDNGPIGALRYQLERRPGRLSLAIRCCRALPKAMIGERAPIVEARLRHGGWKCSTRRQVGLDPVFNEIMVVEVMWTPQDLKSPELILEVKDKALGGGLIAAVRVAVAPFVLHPFMPADVWCPLSARDTKAGIFLGLVYTPSEPSPVISSIENLSSVGTLAWSGMVHVQVLKARGLPASSKDPQIGVRLRVGGHFGGTLPPFQRTAVIRGGGGEPKFNSTFLLGLQQDALGLESQSKRDLLGRTPVLEVEARCSRGKGNVLGAVEIPIFPLWLHGHMTRVWYPMRSSDGESEAGRVHIGLQFLPDGSSAGGSSPTAFAIHHVGGKRRYLFLEVRQARDLHLVHAFSGLPAVHLEMLGSGVRGKTPPAQERNTDPQWPAGAGLLALPYPMNGMESGGGGTGSPSEVLRVTIQNEQDEHSDEQERSAGSQGAGVGDRVVGRCDWPLPSRELESGKVISCWHALWVEGAPTGAVYLRCRVGFEGEALDHNHTLAHELQRSLPDGDAAVPPLAFGNFHVEFLKVRGFERTLRRMGLASDDSSGGSSHRGRGLHWDGTAYLAEAPGSVDDGFTKTGGASAPVASGRAVAVGARGRGGSRPLVVQVSLAGGPSSNDGLNAVVKTLEAVSCVPPDKLLPIAAVPGSELLEWFPCVSSGQAKQRERGEKERGIYDQHTKQSPTHASTDAAAADVKDGSKGGKPGAGEADTGQVLLSIRYAPLAVGVLSVAVCDAHLQSNGNPWSQRLGNLSTLTRILPAQTGGVVGQKARTTPGRRGAPSNLQGDNRGQYTAYSWEDTCPHRMRFNNAFNKQPTTLHVSVVQSDRMIGFASVGVEAIVHDAMVSMAREINEGHRKPRGSAHDVGPVGLFEDDFSGSIQARYPLHAPLTGTSAGVSWTTDGKLPSTPSPASMEIGQIRVEIKFAPHPKVLVKNWQEGAAVTRATGIAAMKAIFYRLNRSGSLVVETEDLRLALADAVDSFLAKPPMEVRASGGLEHETSRASHAGEFVLLLSQGIKPNKGPGEGVALAESAADSILTMLERDRTAEVTFTEFCAFLSQAASWQAEAAIGDLIRELAEDNDDEMFDNDSEDDVGGGDPDGDGVVSLERRDFWRGGQHSGHVTSPASLVDHASHPQMIMSTSPFGDHEKKEKVQMMKSPRRASLGSFSLDHEMANSSAPGVSAGSVDRIVELQENPSTRSTNYGNVKIGRATDERETVNHHHHHHHHQAKRKEATTNTCTPGPRQPLPNDITQWTVAQVLSWLTEDMQLPVHAEKFREASIDGLVLCDLTDTLLQKDLGVPDPLHRLKILRHVQNLYKRQQTPPSHASGSTSWDGPTPTPTPRHDGAREMLVPLARSIGVEVATADGPDARSSAVAEDKGNKSIVHGEWKSQLPGPPVMPSEAKTLGKDKPVAPTSLRDVWPAHTKEDDGGVTTKTTRRADEDDIAGKDEESPVAPGLTLATDEGVSSNIRRLGQLGTARMPIVHRKKRRLPAYATTMEVHEVVQTAMWKAAALLEEGSPSGTMERKPVKESDEYPPAWWGSSEGGSTGRSDSIYDYGGVDHASPGGRNGDGEMTSNDGGERGARLLFDEFCLLRTAENSECTHASKLTRHMLELGIRSLLQIEMKWEQWQLFLDSIPSLRTHGYLNPDEFSTAFAFHRFVRWPRTPDSQSSQSSQHDQPETICGSIDLGADHSGRSGLAVETTAGWGTTATQDISELRDFVLGVADALRTCRQTLGGIISMFDRRGSGEVSVSEYMALIKALTGTSRYSASAEATVGGFDRKKAYKLLRCVDKDGHRTVALRDLVAFVFVVWIEELERLAKGRGEAEETRQRRRQLQKDLRRHFPANFRRALNLDEIKRATATHGPFSSLLTRLGLQVPVPPSPRSQPSFVSPRRRHRQSRTSKSSRGSSHDGVSLKVHSATTEDAPRRQRPSSRRALSISTPSRPSREHRPAPSTSDEQERLGLTARPLAGRKAELTRCSSFEGRVLAIPPQVDLGAMTLTASHNRRLLAQGTFQTSGGGKNVTSAI